MNEWIAEQIAFLGLLVLIAIIVILRNAWNAFKRYRNAKYLKKRELKKSVERGR